MRELLIFVGIIIMTELSAQVVIKPNNVHSNEAYQTIKLKTQSLISFVLKDSLLVEIKYVENHYDAVVHYTDTVRIKKGKTKRFYKKNQETIDTLPFDPIYENDYKFAIIQMKDTSSMVVIDSLTTKILINDKSLIKEPVILLEKPIFSSNFQQAYIRTSIDFKGGCVGYEFHFKFENGNWKKIKSKVIYRC